MQLPELSAHYEGRKPSAIRLAQIEFLKRKDGVDAVNTAIGNVSLPMHPAMQARMRSLGDGESPFADGVVKYTPTVGTEEACRAMLHIIDSSGALHSEIDAPSGVEVVTPQPAPEGVPA